MGNSGNDPPGKASDGDRDPVRRLLQEHGPGVRRRIRGKIPRQWRAVLSADDVMQQTYTDVFLNLHRFVPQAGGSPAAWIFKIANNNLKDIVRMLKAEKRGKNRRQIRIEAQSDSFVALYEILTAGGTRPSQHAARNEAHAALKQAIEKLPEAYRQVVQMFDLDGRPMEEVARALGRSVGAAYRIRSRAHGLLSEFMGTPSKYLSTV